MKKTIYYISLVTICISLFYSCTKKNDAPIFTPWISTTVLGSNWHTNNVHAANDSGTLSITAHFGDTSQIQIRIPADIKKGAYPAGHSFSFFYINTKNINIGFCTLTITLNDQNVIAGTFTTIIYNRWGQKLWTMNNGAFCLNY